MKTKLAALLAMLMVVSAFASCQPQGEEKVEEGQEMIEEAQEEIMDTKEEVEDAEEKVEEGEEIMEEGEEEAAVDAMEKEEVTK